MCACFSNVFILSAEFLYQTAFQVIMPVMPPPQRDSGYYYDLVLYL